MSRRSPSLEEGCEFCGELASAARDRDRLIKRPASGLCDSSPRRPKSPKSPISPSLQPKAQACEGRHRVTVPSAGPQAQLQELHGYVEYGNYDLLLKHVVAQSDTIAMLQMQIQHVNDLLVHQNRHLALALRRPDFETEMPAPLPLDQRPVPCPKPPRNVPLRPMTPLEKSTLGREMYMNMANIRKRTGFRKIVHPSDWWRPGDLPFEVDELEDEMLWKLWHFTRCEKTLQAVLTQDELHACKTASKAAGVGSSTSLATEEEEEEPAADDVPLDSTTAGQGVSMAVRAMNGLKRAENALDANSRHYVAQGVELPHEDQHRKSVSAAVHARNDGARADDEWLQSDSD